MPLVIVPKHDMRNSTPKADVDVKLRLSMVQRRDPLLSVLAGHLDIELKICCSISSRYVQQAAFMFRAFGILCHSTSFGLQAGVCNGPDNAATSLAGKVCSI